MCNFRVYGVSIKHDDSLTGFGATKDIIRKAQSSYFVKQQHLTDKSPVLDQSIGAVYKILDGFYIGAEKNQAK